MKTAFGDPEYIKRVAKLQIQAMQTSPPVIEFRREKRSNEDETKTNTKKLKIKTDPTDEASDELEIKATIFDEGDAEAWVQWRIQLDELIRDMVLETGRQKKVLAKALLKGEAREKFLILINELEMAGIVDGDEAADELLNFDEAIEQLGLTYFPSAYAYRRQRNYLRYHLFMLEMSLADFRAELRRQNNFLRYFPIPDDRESCDMIPDDELVDIVDRAKRVEWQRDLLTANIDPYSLTLDQYYKYLEKLEVKWNIDIALRDDKKRKENHASTSTHNSNAKKKAKIHKSGTAGTATKKRESACVHCGKWHVVTDDKCWGLEKNKKFAPKSNKFVPSKKPQERLFSSLQLEQVMDALRAKEKGKKNPRGRSRIRPKLTTIALIILAPNHPPT